VAIGGRAAGEPNIIAFNTGRGVNVGSANGMSVLSNSIHSNGLLGIDIDGNGVTPNDAGDVDVNRPNFPVITNIVRGGSTTNITGTFDAPTTGDYLLQFFDNAAIDASSHGEGQTLMAELQVTVTVTGTQNFDFTSNVPIANDHFLTANVTDPGNNTSEFSEAIADLTLTHVDAPDPAATGQNITHTFTVTNTSDDFPSGPVTLTYPLHPSATFVSAPGGGTLNAGVVTFNLGTLAIGATATRTVVVKYGFAGDFESTATITSPTTDPAPATNTASATTTVNGNALFFTISGTVRNSGNAGVPNVQMTLSGTQSGTVMTNAQGQYAFTDLALGGAFTITPSQTGQTFTPLSRTFADLQANEIADFALVSGPPPPTGFTISGQVRDLNDTGVPDVTVTLSGSQASTTTTDADGRYAFPGLGAGGTYTVTPSLATFAFNPSNQTFADLQANQFASFFIAQFGTFTRYFAEGATGSFFDTSFALLNATNQPLTATAKFQRDDGQVIAKTLQMPSLTRATIDPKTIPGLEAAAFSTVIESNEPVIADRTMHWDASGYGSHMETSIARPLTRWYLAEGATTGAFNLFYLIQNPTNTDANVEIQYLRPAPAAPISKTHVVKANSRFSLHVNEDDPALDDAEVSAVITSLNDVPVIVERSMYLDSAGQLFGAGHGSAAVADLSTHWFFAEGATGPFFNLFILIANPGSTDAQIEARYLLPSGQVITKPYLSAAHSRLTIGVHAEAPELANTPVSTVLRSTNDVPVLAERAMWWPAAPLAAEWTEGHNSAGAVQTGEKWGLAEGEEGGASSQQTYVLIANTSNFIGSVEVKLIFEDGTTTQLDTPLSVPANSRTTIGIGALFPSSVGRRFGVIVESLGAPAAQLVVERALYNDAIIRGQRVTWAAGANAMGTRLR
jgi:hypothetical protein